MDEGKPLKQEEPTAMQANESLSIAREAVQAARQIAEFHVPPVQRADDWDDRWQVMQTFCADLLGGDEAPIVIKEEDRAAIAKMDYDSHVNEAAQRLVFQQEIAMAALKGLTIVNGGAVIALLTFIGNRTAASETAMAWSFGLFGLGLALALASYIGGYFSQFQLMEATLRQAWDEQRTLAGLPRENDFRTSFNSGNAILYASIGTAVLSLAAFVAGSMAALNGIFYNQIGKNSLTSSRYFGTS